jgi:uncharacterized protein
VTPTYTAFAGPRFLASGELRAVQTAAADASAKGDSHIVILEDGTGRLVDLDAIKSPTVPDPLLSMSASLAAPRVRGRPRLGVVAREVTLLPRHWEWLGGQPGGASAALRRLVEDARKRLAGADRARQAQQAVYSAMSVLAGDLPGFEEATRALYGGNDPGLDAALSAWPPDIQHYIGRLITVERLAREVF